MVENSSSSSYNYRLKLKLYYKGTVYDITQGKYNYYRGVYIAAGILQQALQQSCSKLSEEERR